MKGERRRWKRGGKRKKEKRGRLKMISEERQKERQRERRRDEDEGLSKEGHCTAVQATITKTKSETM